MNPECYHHITGPYLWDVQYVPTHIFLLLNKAHCTFMRNINGFQVVAWLVIASGGNSSLSEQRFLIDNRKKSYIPGFSRKVDNKLVRKFGFGLDVIEHCISCLFYPSAFVHICWFSFFF